MRAARSRRRTTGVRFALGALALAATLLGTGSGAVFASGQPGAPGGPGVPPGNGADPGLGPVLEPPAPPGGQPSVPASPPAAPEMPPAAQDSVPAGDPGPPPAPAQQAPLFPEDRQPPPNVSNVSLTGEAYVVRQDLKAPPELHLGRYPRATTEVSKDLTTAFGAFADPGFLGRFAAGDRLKSTGSKDTQAPAWAECVYPQSPMTPTEDVRSPGQGASLTAAAKCFPGAGQAQGYYLRDPGPNATAGASLLSATGAGATVDAASNAAGSTATLSYSSLDDVNLANVVTIKSMTNKVGVRTNGRPGGAVVETSATIHGMTVSGAPVELPSDSLEKLGPTLAQLPPVLSPLGVLTFDVIPAQKEVAADGTSAFGRAAQLLVTLKNGESTVSFGVGFASARGRTILNEFTAPGTSGRVPPFRPGIIGGVGPLRPAGGPRSVEDFIGSIQSGLGFRSAPRGTRAPAPSPGGGIGNLPSAGLNVLPPPPPPSQVQNAGEREQYGGDGPWLALMGGSVIGLGLARYLAYSTALRPTPV